MFIYLENESSSCLNLGSTVKQVELKHNIVFVNKRMSMMLNLSNIIPYVYMYTCIKIQLYRLEIRLFKFVNKLIRISNYYLYVLII